MASHDNRSEVERIKEVLRLLDLARDECVRYLAELERSGRRSVQDNQPRPN